MEGNRRLPWPQREDRPALGGKRAATHSPAVHEKRGSVYAYTGELDRWWAARQLTVKSGFPSNESEPQELELPERAGEGDGTALPGNTLISPAAGSPAAITADSLAPKTSGSPRRTDRFQLPSPKLPAASAGVAAVLLSMVLAPFAWHWVNAQGAFESGGPIRSLAVLPLKNLSGEAGQQYFADGMTDELITELAKISALRVISRTSVMQYRDEKKSLPEIARQLKVDAVVEGTLLRAGDRVRITAQLIRPVPETHLWSKSYERDLRNVSDLEREVARTIASEIKIQLTYRERAGLSTARPLDPLAHEDYLWGIYFWNKRTEKDLQKSIESFDRAVQRDPSYALAYAGLANAYNSLGVYAHFRPREIYPKARAAALKALSLDDTLAEAHAALCLYYSNYEWDQASSDRECRRAIELNPGYVLAHVWRGETLSVMQRHAEALAELDRAHELDPTSLMVSDQRGWVLYMARRYDEAIEQLRKTVELEPRFAHAHCWLGKAYLQKGMLQQGLSELEEAQGFPGATARSLHLGWDMPTRYRRSALRLWRSSAE